MEERSPYMILPKDEVAAFKCIVDAWVAVAVREIRETGGADMATGWRDRIFLKNGLDPSTFRMTENGFTIERLLEERCVVS